MQGSNYERDLARLLYERGYHVMRAPSSGGGTSRDLPDLFWADSESTPIAAEMKATSQNVAYFSQEESTALKQFSMAFGANARFVSRFAQDTSYYVHAIADGRYTDSGQIAIDRDIAPVQVIQP